jgi:two-component system nitrogen regulation response regulator NtrX
MVARAVEAAELKRENQELKLRGGPETVLVGEAPVICSIRAAIGRVAPTGSRVLITGPPGSGKEVVARQLHLKSKREHGPFVVVNAASMAPERMEVELFGTEGRLRESERGKVGLFEQAHGGTLFIDEVADMPLETQGKILRVLVDQTFVRVGGSQRVRVDVRVISASNRDLGEETRHGRFREDLYHRLNVVPITVPSLKERATDIPLLVNYFMKRESEVLGLPARKVSADALAALQAAQWPGNVRELRNLIARLLILAPGDARTPIGADMLPPELGAARPGTVRSSDGTEIIALPLRDAREVFEREYLMAQITRFGGNISRTANFIGMERSALHRKLKSLGVTTNERPQVD